MAQLSDRDSFRAVPAEPVDDGHHDGGESGEVRTQRDQGEREIEGQDRLDLAEQHETGRENHEANAHDRARTESVDQPALHWREQTKLNLCHDKGARDDRLAPVELVLQNDEPDAVGLHPQQCGEHLYSAGSGCDPPAVEHPAGRSNRRVDLSPRRAHFGGRFASSPHQAASTPTGQWSEPTTSGQMKASVTRFAAAFDAST